MTNKKIGIIFIVCAFLISIYCLLDKSVFRPDGDILVSYLLARNLVIISMINWLFIIGILLIKISEKSDKKID